MAYTVQVVASMAGISIRTLHHYDKIGLLKPANKSAAGYRLYSEQNLEKLQQILFFRELGFGLQEIKSIIEQPGYDRTHALRSHRQLLVEKRKRIGQLIKTIDSTIDALEGGSQMETKDRFDGFDESKIEEHKQEARERWGHTKAYRESEEKTAHYSKADWKKIFAESGDIYGRVAELMIAGKDPGDSEVQAQAGQWFDHITTNFYSCTPEIFRGLAQGYVEDARFTANIDKVEPGLAAFLSRAMRIYADSIETGAGSGW